MKSITKEQKDFLDNCTYGTWRLNSETGLVDVLGNFVCSNMGLSDFREIKFGCVEGFFDCSNNQLVSLEGAPKKVHGYFDCSHNKLISLKEGPQKAEGSYNCSFNQLVSLESAPQDIEGYFDCSYNKLISLAGFFIKVKNSIYCDHNSLDSLGGVNFDIGSLIYCDPISLRGCPPDLLNTIIYFYIDGYITLEDVFYKGITYGLSHEIYLSKMV